MLDNMSRDLNFPPGIKIETEYASTNFYIFDSFPSQTSALGAFVQEENTFLECAENRTNGRYEQDSNDDKSEHTHNLRNNRLFACI